MSMLKIKTKIQETVTVITPVGRIDVQQMLQLRNFFTDLENKSAFHVAVDMAGVTFIDSYGVSILTNFFNRLKLHEGWFVFFNCKKEIKDFLKVTGVDQVIPLFESFEEIKAQYPE